MALRRNIIKRVIMSAIALSLAAMAGGAIAQHDEHHGDAHHESFHRADSHHLERGSSHGWQSRSDWRRGGHIGSGDWRRGRVVDYRSHHLRRPPRGYAWREVDGKYVLAAVATGIIADIILNSH